MFLLQVQSEPGKRHEGGGTPLLAYRPSEEKARPRPPGRSSWVCTFCLAFLPVAIGYS